MADNKVKYSVLNEKGDEVFEASPAEALADIKEKVEKESRWIYVDKEIMDFDELTEDILMEAEDILLAHEHAGG